MGEEKKISKTIIFYTVPLKIEYAEMKKVLLDDPILCNAIQDYSRDLWVKANIETFLIDKNMIITEDGYKIVFYEEEAKAIEEAKSGRVTK